MLTLFFRCPRRSGRPWRLRRCRWQRNDRYRVPPVLPVPLEILIDPLVADRPLASPGEPPPDFYRAPLLPDQGLHPLPV